MNINIPIQFCGKGLVDYQQIFNLTVAELKLTIVDCFSSINSFCADMRSQQHEVSSVFEPQIKTAESSLPDYLNKVQTEMVQYIQTHPQLFKPLNENETKFQNFVQHIQQNLNHFAHDYMQHPHVYKIADCVNLPFHDYEFDMALSADYIFHTATSIENIELTIKRLLALCRIAREVRIYPLMTYTGELSPQLGGVMAALQAQDIGVEIRAVSYAFQTNANAMLRVWSNRCVL